MYVLSIAPKDKYWLKQDNRMANIIVKCFLNILDYFVHISKCSVFVYFYSSKEFVVIVYIIEKLLMAREIIIWR